ncbi:MAG: FG-GAP-like repeat-containing protein [bacterium]
MKSFGKHIKIVFITPFILLICLQLTTTRVLAGFNIGPMEAVESRAEDLDKKISSHWVKIWDNNCEELYEPYWKYEESRKCALDAAVPSDVIDYWNSNPNRAPAKFLTKTENYESPKKFILADTPLGKKGMSAGKIAWADVNRNGRLDMAFAGLDSDSNARLVIFENMGDGEFQIAAQPLEEGGGLRSASLAWGDFNNSGRLDLAVLGYDDGGDEGSPRLIVFRNDGDFTFEVAGEPLGDGGGLERGDLTWVDYNNDGMMDLVAAGFDGSYSRFIVFPNQTTVEDGSEEFTSGARTEPFGDTNGLSNFSAVAAGDFNGDGWPDLAALGADAQTHEKKLVAIENLGLENNGGTDTWFAAPGDTSFYDLTTISDVSGLDRGDLAWGDLLYDTGLELAVVGHSGSNKGHLYIFSYAAGGGFNLEYENNNGLKGLRESSIALGDYNNSGRPDLLVSGKDNEGNKRLIVYKNRRTYFENVYEPVKEATGETGVFLGDASWADYSGRGRLSFGAGGAVGVDRKLWLFENYVNDIENNRPNQPDNLRETVYEDTVVLKWDAPVDDFTARRKLSYLVKVESEPSIGDVVKEGSKNNHETYHNLLGRVHPPRTDAIIYDLEAGSYDWTVRAIDSGYKLSSWNFDGSSFEISEP